MWLLDVNLPKKLGGLLRNSAAPSFWSSSGWRGIARRSNQRLVS